MHRCYKLQRVDLPCRQADIDSQLPLALELTRFSGYKVTCSGTFIITVADLMEMNARAVRRARADGDVAYRSWEPGRWISYDEWTHEQAILVDLRPVEVPAREGLDKVYRLQMWVLRSLDLQKRRLRMAVQQELEAQREKVEGARILPPITFTSQDLLNKYPEIRTPAWIGTSPRMK